MRPLPLLLLLLAAPLARAAPPGVTVSWTPERVVLGQDSRVALKVRVPKGSGPVRGAASSGTFTRERVEGGEVRVFEWTPPPVRYPLVAVLAFWVEDGAPLPGVAPSKAEAAGSGPSEVGVVRIPLLGKTQLDVSTDAGASVVVEVDGKHFGPVKADDRGRARVPVEVPPGVLSASVLATRDTLRTRAAIPLDPPTEQPLVAALLPSPLPATGGGWLLVAGEEGLVHGDVELSVEGARLSAVSEESLLRYRVTPKADATAITVTVRRKGQDDTARAVAELTRVTVPPPVLVQPPVTPTPPPAPTVAGAWHPSVFVLVGGAFASGANTGPMGAVGVSLVPPWWRERLAVELEAGLRRVTFDGGVDALGSVHSRVLAVPVLASVRVGVFQGAAVSLYGRAGGGLLPFQHRLSSDFQEDVKESKLAGMGFLSFQGAYRLGRWSVLAEVRGAWAPARTPWLDAQLGGLSGLLGARFEP
ncbi:hypothetical protein [Pyxidicoccus trucidator]|uniref:hypothetical protein n=1 Tax=Pyxidicoccus trucidator TaxID=2709662 RepID=UPI0013DD220E|nr:hypothetical protein [Pyxidicoccus trucidator]